MWVVGFTLLIDGLDQYIVRGDSNQLKAAFHVNDVDIAILFSAFILVNGIATLPSGYLADRWNRTKAMAVTIVAWSVISAVGGLVPTSAFLLLVHHPRHARLRPGHHRPLGQQRDRRLLRHREARQGLLHPAVPQLRRPRVGLVIGGALGPLFHGQGWRVAFFVSIIPGLVVAWMCWRLPEPSRGTADRAHVTHSDEMEVSDQKLEPLFPHGVKVFTREMVSGLNRDMRVIMNIPTLRYALVGVSTVGFVVTAVGTWMPSFYQNQLGLTQTKATAHLRPPARRRGHPRHHLGRVDRRPLGQPRAWGRASSSPPSACSSSATLIVLSFARIPHGLVFLLQLIGLWRRRRRCPALRAGLSDVSPAQVRGAGFAAFNLASVVFGSAAAPLVTAAVAAQFDNDYRTAFLIVMPIAFVGAAFLLLARRHIEQDSAKVFEAVVTAMAANQAEEAAYAAGRDDGPSGRGRRARRPATATRSPRAARPCPSRPRRPGGRRPRPRCSPCGRRRR